jgi:hypothetical protein
MNVKATLSVILVAAAVAGVVGCKKKSPTSPDIVRTTTSTPPPQVSPLPISVVAPYIGQTISSVLEQSLTQGLTATGANRWLVNCPAGGNAKLELSPTYQVQTGNVVMLEDTELTLSECQVETKGATYINSPTLLGRLLNLIVRPVAAQSRQRLNIRGRVRTRGKWRAPIITPRGPEYRTGEGARVTGSIDVTQVNCGGGTCPPQNPIGMDCVLNGEVCAGTIGGQGVTQGPKDMPPNPTPTTTTTTTTIPPTTTVPPTTINVTGTWTEVIVGSLDSGTRSVVLTQTGSTVRGDTSGLPPEFTGTFTGTVSGNRVTLNEVYNARIPVPGVGTGTCRFTMQHNLTATSNTRMSGPYSGSVACTVPGAPPFNFPDSGSSTWTR